MKKAIAVNRKKNHFKKTNEIDFFVIYVKQKKIIRR